MNNQQSDTKQKIMDVANKLFYRFGYEGTSIRQISQEANVNIAAINYHFKNKEHLFIDIFINNYNWTREQILLIQQQYPANIQKFCHSLFTLFKDNGPFLVTGFKFIIGDHISTDECIKRCTGMPQGPPGYDILMKVIDQDLNIDIDKSNLYNASMGLTSIIIHKALMLHSNIIQARIKQSSINHHQEIINCLNFHIAATTNYLLKLSKGN